MSNKKPVVSFQMALFAEQGQRAELHGVKGHPVLGDIPDVLTSTVMDIEYDAPTGAIVTIETRNTTYVLEGKPAASCDCSGCGCG